MGLQKIVGNLIDKLRELHMNGHLEICSRPQVIENLPNILQKTVVLVNLAENLHCLLLLLLLLQLLWLLLLNSLFWRIWLKTFTAVYSKILRGKQGAFWETPKWRTIEYAEIKILMMGNDELIAKTLSSRLRARSQASSAHLHSANLLGKDQPQCSLIKWDKVWS